MPGNADQMEKTGNCVLQAGPFALMQWAKSPNKEDR